MKYQINKTNYHDFSVFQENRLPARSYFIPYPTRVEADAVPLKEKRYRSSKVQCLNGMWDFKFYPRPMELPDIFDTDAVSFDTIDVPSCWQFRGYDRPFYVNTRYQFPYHPPVIPTEEKVGKVFSWVGFDRGLGPRWQDPGDEYNFVGVYRRKIQISDPGKNTVISFLGVASCLDLYWNGKYIGYSEGSHNTAEFDLTGKLCEGENELLAVVHRWCSGTYLEAQDMFRNNGIFRDVLLRISEPEDFWDVDARTWKSGEQYGIKLTAQALSDTGITFSLEGHGVACSASVQTRNGFAEAVFDHLDIKEWNAEAPVLYTIRYETKTCSVKEKIGFRTVEIQGDVFLVNGRKIKLRGVNHHDTSPTNGYTMTPDEIEKDLLLCKRYNIDTIRTSHYPPDPLLLELADELGIYIIDENDLETHGTFSHQLPPTYNSISHNSAWRPRYVDRIEHLYERDKLHGNTAIIMWSLGNEAGGYSNTDAMYHFLKARSPLPVHYESAIHCKRQAYDVGSEMYPSVAKVHKVGEHCRKQKRLNDRPYFLCEYAHAMGVGPGNTEAYWQEIYRYDNLMGGCVWEMVDHAVLHSDGSFTYGGDHGEWEHDGNFCVDGMFYPDRKPSTGAEIIRFIYRPLRVTYISGNRFEVFNTMAFSDGERYELTFLWNDGTEDRRIPDVEPLSRAQMTIQPGRAVEGICAVLIITRDRKTGNIVSEEYLTVTQKLPSAPKQKKLLPQEFSTTNGAVSLILPDGSKLTSAQQYTLLYRVATDNDTDLTFRNAMKPWYSQKEELLSIEMTNPGVRNSIGIRNAKAKFVVTDSYVDTEEGILVTSELQCKSERVNIPRFGKCFHLDETFDDVTYFGRSGESYCDMKEQFPVREVSCKVGDMTEPNLRPQESGNRCDCTEASFSNGKIKVTFRAVDRPFELGVKPYSDQELIGMKHREDEKRTGTYVTIQAFQQGIGTGACGPGVAPEYLYPSNQEYRLRFLIKVEKL